MQKGDFTLKLFLTLFSSIYLTNIYLICNIYTSSELSTLSSYWMKFHILTLQDLPKLNRCTELLSMQEELKQARKAFEVDEEKLASIE